MVIAGRANLTIVRRTDPTAGGRSSSRCQDGKLKIEASGAPVLDFEKGAPIAVVRMSSNEVFMDGSDDTRMAFVRDEAGTATRLVRNPGPWQITGQRIN